MIRDSKSTSKFTAVLVLLLILCNRTTGGSWKKLERMFIHDHDSGEHWDENRIIFPDSIEDSTESRWRSTTPRGGNIRRPCEDDCPVSREYSPVCGTNAVTYQNMGQLLCAIRCGEAVDLHQPSACSAVPTFTTTTPAPRITTSATITTDRSEEMEKCIRTCPSTPEYNPVCGTDYITYNNMGKLQCAKICGADVNFWRYSRCPILQSTTSTTIAPTPNHDEDNVRKACLLNCPFTSEYNPVCGTDNVTYENFGRLECAKFCGIDVSMLRQGRCTVFQNRQNFDDYGSSTSEDDYGDEAIDPRFRNRGRNPFQRK